MDLFFATIAANVPGWAWVVFFCVLVGLALKIGHELGFQDGWDEGTSHVRLISTTRPPHHYDEAKPT